MEYSKLFNESLAHLRSLGFTAEAQRRATVTLGEIESAERRNGSCISPSMKRFLTEMGDGYSFSVQFENRRVFSWEPIYLNDYSIHNCGFWQQVEEDGRGFAPGYVDQARLRAEIERRKVWKPFYGFTSGAGLLCFDERERVRYYEPIEWTHSPDSWDCVIADSFDDFVGNWSRYCFVSSGDLMAILARDTAGFSWSTDTFPLVEGTSR